MKSLKINLGLVALLLGVGVAYASGYSNMSEVTYGKLPNGTWVLAQEGYSCEPEGESCTATFDPQIEDPNNGGTPSNEVSGTFIQGI